jgi:hypothetical protein
MNWEALGAIGEIVGAAAVVVTLGYLAVQIRQNTRAVKVTGYQQLISGLQQLSMIATQDPAASEFVARAYREYGDLSEEDRRRASSFFMGQLVTFQSHHHMYRQKLLDEELWQSHEENLARLMRLPGVRSWWDSRTFTFSRSFVQLVDGLTAGIDKSTP